MSREIEMKEYKKYIKNLNEVEKKIKTLPLSRVDEEAKLLKEIFNFAYEKNCFKLYNFDKELQDKLKFKLFSKLTKHSASFTFLAIQILAANAIMAKNNFPKREHYFKQKCGIAINHLRMKKSFVKAKKCEGGYELTGVLTWASGYKIFDHLLIGFHYKDQELEGLSLFQENKSFKIIDLPETFVGQSLNTVNVKLENFFIKDEDIVSKNPIGNYTKNKSLSKTVHYALYGLGIGSLNFINDKNLKANSKEKLKKIKNAFMNTNHPEELDKLRVKLFNTLQKIITLAMIVDGGKSILKEKTLQRYYRELIMFNANGLNEEIKSLFLEKF
ncbi:hypothetical protein [Halarcobacter ebronensis]|uniref:Acyl-CoA dehydrogenase n=1 Tax=Halarcobacter ebronensis TaxID=1462615 RepID=A0A4Q1AK51_9BACT|nr:hypothetical protein [Halarcobacter ebronensis]QKF81364.1 hypothetical protein AEBR_0865 [Halarcobacter ebronensis]RXK04925.1 hypothetical protein CRV07_10075 [Halarcobacter ebronensis]